MSADAAVTGMRLTAQAHRFLPLSGLFSFPTTSWELRLNVGRWSRSATVHSGRRRRCRRAPPRSGRITGLLAREPLVVELLIGAVLAQAEEHDIDLLAQRVVARKHDA